MATEQKISFVFANDDEELDLEQELDDEVIRQSIGPVFYLKKGEEQLVRFFNWKGGTSLIKHEKYERQKDGTGKYVVQTFCPRYVGKECIWCDMGEDKAAAQGVRRIKMFGQQIWNITGNREQLFLYAVNKASPLQTLNAMNKARNIKTKGKGSIADYNITIHQEGEGQQRSFICTPEAPEPFIFKGEVWDRDTLVEKMMIRVSPELIGKQRGDGDNKQSADTDEIASDLDL